MQFLECRVCVLFFNIRKHVRDQIHQRDHYKCDRFEDDHQSPDRIGELHGEIRRVFLGADLGDRLTENDDQNRDHGSGYPSVLIAQDHHDSDRSHGGGSNIYQVVAYKDRGNGIVKLICYLESDRSFFIAVVALMLQAHFVACGEGHLRRREKRGAHDTYNYSYEINVQTAHYTSPLSFAGVPITRA